MLSKEELGRYLRNVRKKEKDISLRDVYKLTGITYTHLSMIENGKRNVTPALLKNLAELYGLDYLDLYEKAGYIDLIAEEQKKKYKTDELGNSVVSIDLLGTIKAGYDWIANEDKIGTIDIPVELAKTGDFFALKVKGDSMADAILEDDIVIIKKQDFAEDGEIVAAIINGDEVTLKKFRKTENGIKLMPLNRRINPATGEPFYDDLYFTKEEIESKPVTIIGVLKKQERIW